MKYENTTIDKVIFILIYKGATKCFWTCSVEFQHMAAQGLDHSYCWIRM